MRFGDGVFGTEFLEWHLGGWTCLGIYHVSREKLRFDISFSRFHWRNRCSHELGRSKELYNCFSICSSNHRCGKSGRLN